MATLLKWDIPHTLRIQMTENNIIVEIKVRPSLRILTLYITVFLLLLTSLFYFFENSALFELLWRVVIMLGAITIGHAAISRIHTRYTLDPLDLTEISGYFSKRAIKVPLNRITDYQVSRSFLQRLLGLGNIYINTPGGIGYELILRELTEQDLTTMANGLENLFEQQKIADAGRNEALVSARKQALDADDGKLDV